MPTRADLTAKPATGTISNLNGVSQTEPKALGGVPMRRPVVQVGVDQGPERLSADTVPQEIVTPQRLAQILETFEGRSARYIAQVAESYMRGTPPVGSAFRTGRLLAGAAGLAFWIPSAIATNPLFALPALGLGVALGFVGGFALHFGFKKARNANLAMLEAGFRTAIEGGVGSPSAKQAALAELSRAYEAAKQRS